MGDQVQTFRRPLLNDTSNNIYKKMPVAVLGDLQDNS
jgi:hypothetical protein